MNGWLSQTGFFALRRIVDLSLMGLCVSVPVSEEGYDDMVFAKRLWLYASVLVVLLCVVLGAFLVWRANQPVELKTVYVLPKPNPERAGILKQALQPRQSVYIPHASSDEATRDGTTSESLEADSGDSSSQENEFEEDNFESVLAAIDEETAEEQGDFPPVPSNFPSHLTPVWEKYPGYRKGDMPEHEWIYRVLIKLWNQGDYEFKDGAFTDGKVYPLYPDVLYVKWRDSVLENADGNPITFRYIAFALGTHPREFNPDDFISGDWRTKHSGTTFVPYEEAGYNPTLFLAD